MSTSTTQSTHQQPPARFTPRSEHGKVLAAHREAVIALATEHGMSNVRVFGSATSLTPGTGLIGRSSAQRSGRTSRR